MEKREALLVETDRAPRRLLPFPESSASPKAPRARPWRGATAPIGNCRACTSATRANCNCVFTAVHSLYRFSSARLTRARKDDRCFRRNRSYDVNVIMQSRAAAAVFVHKVAARIINCTWRAQIQVRRLPKVSRYSAALPPSGRSAATSNLLVFPFSLLSFFYSSLFFPAHVVTDASIMSGRDGKRAASESPGRV